jgi:hypothetical protein
MGRADGVATTTGSVRLARSLAATSDGSSTAQATLANAGSLQATSLGHALVVGSIALIRGLSGRSDGIGSVIVHGDKPTNVINVADEIYFGGVKVAEVYLGATKVWPP